MTYAKAFMAALVALATSIGVASSNGFTTTESVTILVTTLVAGAVVFTVPNINVGVAKYGKAVVGAVLAGAAALTTALQADGNLGALTVADWMTVLVAVVVAAGGVAAVSGAPMHVVVQGVPEPAPGEHRV